ncbi:MAG: energy-coupling factor ABC transporter ATP-binding protein [Lachnospiraceae bacterium]|nr:energy-coupling factor ABC transporter ATP-binding protein [Lachnospiraceae bacterium]
MGYIKLSNITFTYNDDEKPIISDLSFCVDRGQCVLILGDNGSGKSTLLRILNGLSFPQSGEYLFDGEKITENCLKDNVKSKLFHKEIGFLFQNPDVMLFNAKVYDEVAFGPRQMGLSDDEVDRRTKDCMRMMGIEDLYDKAPYHLSGGQKKKVALASVLALNPSVLVLDEPFAGLDKKSETFLMDLLFELKESGKTLIIATHDEARLERLRDVSLRL